MSNIDKQWLQQKIADMETTRDEIPFGLDEDDSNTLAALRIALASLEAEAIYQVWDDGKWCDYEESLWREVYDEHSANMFRIVYTSPPAPVVPETSDREMLKRLAVILSGSDAPGEIRSLNVTAQSFVDRCKVLAKERDECRIAMLLGADGSSPVTPDRSDDTTRLDWLDAQNKRLNEYYGTSYGWKFDANFQRNAMMLNDSNYPVMTVRQAIDEAIATAPKQEVK